MTKYTLTLLFSLTILSCALGCGGKESASSATPAAAPPKPTAAPEPAASSAGPVSCQVNVTGGETASWTGHLVGTDAPIEAHGKVIAVSEYFMSEGAIREALAAVGRAADFEHKKTPAQLNQELEVSMKKDPRLDLLRLHCVTEGGSLILTAASSSTHSDVPFGPKSYRLGGLMAQRGEFSIERFHIADRPAYRVTEGKLELAKFDASGVKGTFTFGAKASDGKTVDVSGSFDYPNQRGQ